MSLKEDIEELKMRLERLQRLYEVFPDAEPHDDCDDYDYEQCMVNSLTNHAAEISVEESSGAIYIEVMLAGC